MEVEVEAAAAAVAVSVAEAGRPVGISLYHTTFRARSKRLFTRCLTAWLFFLRPRGYALQFVRYRCVSASQCR